MQWHGFDSFDTGEERGVIGAEKIKAIDCSFFPFCAIDRAHPGYKGKGETAGLNGRHISIWQERSKSKESRPVNYFSFCFAFLAVTRLANGNSVSMYLE
jgi:hypothetical protein